MPNREATQGRGDLTVTALYTAQTWRWGKLPASELLTPPQAIHVFRTTNAVLGLGRLWRRDWTSMRHSLLQRHLMLDRLVAQQHAGHVLELASGLSPRGARLSADPSVRYTELDLPAMVATKRRLLEQTPAGSAVLARDNFALVPGDVTQTPFEPLCQGAPAPLCVLAEGICMYLSADEQRAFWRRIAALCAAHKDSAFAFDLVPTPEQPRPGLWGRALLALVRALTGGRGFVADTRDRAALVAELHACGFAHVDVLTPDTAPNDWALPYRDIPTKVVIFYCRV